MKKSTAVILLLLCCANSTIQAQDSLYSTPISQTSIGIEVLRPLFWFMKDLGFVLEPEFTYQHKGIMYNATIGYSSINDEIYQALDYKNTGSYLKLGVGVQLNYRKDRNRPNKIIIGANLVFASYSEKATVLNGSSSFGIIGQELTQKNSARGIETYFSYRREFENNLYASISPNINIILSELNNDEFQVYYVPGFGIVSNDEGDGISVTPFSESGEASAIGLSVKIGYRF